MGEGDEANEMAAACAAEVGRPRAWLPRESAARDWELHVTGDNNNNYNVEDRSDGAECY